MLHDNSNQDNLNSNNLNNKTNIKFIISQKINYTFFKF